MIKWPHISRYWDIHFRAMKVSKALWDTFANEVFQRPRIGGTDGVGGTEAQHAWGGPIVSQTFPFAVGFYQPTRDLWSQCECLGVLHSCLPFSWGYVTLPLLLMFVSCQSQLSLFCIISLLARSLPLKFSPVRSQIICAPFQNSKFFMHLMDPREPVHRSKKTRIQLRRSLRCPQIGSPQVTNLKVNPLKKTFKTDRVWSLEVDFGTPETNFVSIISNWKCKSHDHMSCIFPLVECHARAASACVRSLQLFSIRIHGTRGKARHRSHFEPVSSKFWFCWWETWSFFTEDLSKQKSSRFQSCLRLKYEFLSEEIPRSCGLMLCWLGMKPIIMSSRVGICRTVDPMMDVAIEGRLSTVPCQEKGRTWLQAEQVKWISNYHDVSRLSMLQTSFNKSSVPPNLRNTVVLPCSWSQLTLLAASSYLPISRLCSNNANIWEGTLLNCWSSGVLLHWGGYWSSIAIQFSRGPDNCSKFFSHAVGSCPGLAQIVLTSCLASRKVFSWCAIAGAVKDFAKVLMLRKGKTCLSCGPEKGVRKPTGLVLPLERTIWVGVEFRQCPWSHWNSRTCWTFLAKWHFEAFGCIASGRPNWRTAMAVWRVNRRVPFGSHVQGDLADLRALQAELWESRKSRTAEASAVPEEQSLLDSLECGSLIKECKFSISSRLHEAPLRPFVLSLLFSCFSCTGDTSCSSAASAREGSGTFFSTEDSKDSAWFEAWRGHQAGIVALFFWL